MSYVCEHGEYNGGSEACGKCKRALEDQADARASTIATQAERIKELEALHATQYARLQETLPLIDRVAELEAELKRAVEIMANDAAGCRCCEWDCNCGIERDMGEFLATARSALGDPA